MRELSELAARRTSEAKALLSRAPVRIGIFLAGLAVTLAAGYGLGTLSGAGVPPGDAPPVEEHP